MHRRQTLQWLAQQEDCFLEESITTAEDERTAMSKADKKNMQQQTIDNAHNQSKAKPTASITQCARNNTYGICTAFNRVATQILTNKKTSNVWRAHQQQEGACQRSAPHVRFRSRQTLCERG